MVDSNSGTPCICMQQRLEGFFNVLLMYNLAYKSNKWCWLHKNGFGAWAEKRLGLWITILTASFLFLAPASMNPQPTPLVTLVVPDLWLLCCARWTRHQAEPSIVALGDEPSWAHPGLRTPGHEQKITSLPFLLDSSLGSQSATFRQEIKCLITVIVCNSKVLRVVTRTSVLRWTLQMGCSWTLVPLFLNESGNGAVSLCLPTFWLLALKWKRTCEFAKKAKYSFTVVLFERHWWSAADPMSAVDQLSKPGKVCGCGWV